MIYALKKIFIFKKNYYVKKIDETESKGLGYFHKKFNLQSKKNIYIVIAESYAFFKENNMNEELIDIFKNDGNKVILDQNSIYL